MHMLAKAYYCRNRANWMLCLYLGQLTVARAAALDSQLSPAHPGSYADHSGRWVVRGLTGRGGLEL